MIVLEILSGLFLLAGTAILLAGAVGVLRFPDLYSRLHPAGLCDTLGQALVLLGLVLLAGFSLVSLKLLLIMFFIFLLNPTATHAIARGAWVCGYRPWRKGDEPVLQREGQMSMSDRDEVVAAGEVGPPSTPGGTGEARDG